MKHPLRRFRMQTREHRELLGQVPKHSRVRRFSTWGLPGYIALVLTVILLLAVLDIRGDEQEQHETDQDIALVAAETKIAACLDFNRLLVVEQDTRELLTALATSAVARSDNPALIKDFNRLLRHAHGITKQNCLRKLLEVEAELGLKLNSQRPLTVRP